MEHEEAISKPSTSAKRDTAEQPLLARRQKLRQDIAAADAEIQSYEEEIRALRALVSFKKDERLNLEKELETTHASRPGKGKGKGKGKDKAKQGIDYSADEFEWSYGLKTKMKEIFGIQDFRLCQKG
jgi:ATP-dependent DNA helicase Q1